jgi:hypothetical protein
MSEYLRLSAGGYGFLLPREAIAAVRVIEAGIAPLALHQRAPRPSVYIDARRLLGQSVDDSRKLRNLVSLETAPRETDPDRRQFCFIVDRADRIETHDPDAFQALPRGLAFLKPDIDGVLGRERRDEAVLRLRLPSGRSPRALLRRWRQAAVALDTGAQEGEGAL